MGKICNNPNPTPSLPWRLIYVLYLPFGFLYLCLFAIPTSLRLALANADRVIFVFATSILSFYQVPRLVFFIYITILIVTGLVQFLRTDSSIRVGLLLIVDWMTMGKAILFLRKYSNLHYSNPYTRLNTLSQTIFVPVGHIVLQHNTIEMFEFPISRTLSFNSKVGDCTISRRTLQGSRRSNMRYSKVKAPWGAKGVTFRMEDANLGRFVGYSKHVAASQCKQVLCTHSRFSSQCRALTIAETIEHFNRGLSLVKLGERGDHDFYFIY